MPLGLKLATESAIARYIVGTLAFVFAWKTLAASFGIVPDASTLSNRYLFAVYMVCPVEPRYVGGAHVPSSARSVVPALREAALKQLALSLYASAAPGRLFAAPSGLAWADSWVKTALLYLFLSQQAALQACALAALAGAQPVEIFRDPLLRSRSPRDFWGERWNLIVHGLLKRSVFVPSRRVAGTAAAAAATFGASALFHVYVLCAACEPPWADMARMAGFFMAQFPLTFLEVALLRHFPWARRLPTPLCAAITTLAILPVAPLFLGPYERGGMYTEMQKMQPTIAWVPA